MSSSNVGAFSDSKTGTLTTSVYEYLLSHCLRETKEQRELREATQSHSESASMMVAAPDQGAFLQLLLKVMGAKRVLEVGALTLYTSLTMALALPDGGKVVALDITDEYPSVGLPFFEAAGIRDRLDLRLGPAVESMDAMIEAGEEGTFDLIFIDADKTNYSNYYERALKLVRQNGIVAIDNVLWGGKVADDSVQTESTKAIRALNELVREDDRVDIVMLGISDGVTLARKK